MNFADKNIVFLDFETFYDTRSKYGLKELSMTEYIRDPRFKAHGLAWKCDKWLYPDTMWVTGSRLALVLSDIDWSSTVIVSHNVKFDGAILAWHYGVKPYAWFDTVALAKAVLGENVSGYSLAGLAEYLGLKSKGTLKWDGVRDLTEAQEEEMAAYCKNDTDICKGIYEKLIAQFPQNQFKALDWTVRSFVEPTLRLDAKILATGVDDEKKRREEIIKASGVEKSVLASNKQFAELLEQHGYKVPTKLSARTGKSIPAFARTDSGLDELRTASPVLYAARIASKANLLETRGESLLAVAKTGAFPFDVGFSGAVQTHRYSGGSGAGGNPQNFTRKSFLRDAVCAPSGYSLVVGDFAAIELRILAWLAKEPKLINKLINDEDVYAAFASEFYGKRVAPKESTPERLFGKCAILGLGYGMGGDKFKKTADQAFKKYIEEAKVKGLDTTGMPTEITEGAAYNAVKFYRTTYFNVPKLWEACNSLIPLIAEERIGCLYFAPFLKVQKAAVILPSGLVIRYPNLRRIDDEWVYDVYHKKYDVEQTKLYGGKLVENICQGLAGELCKEAITRAEAAGLHPVGQVHDEILCIDQDPAFASVELKRCMEQSPTWMPEMRLKAEVGYGRSWNEAKH